MKHNSDDRRDNVEKIQSNINNTIENIEFTNVRIAKTDDEKSKEFLEKKNDRRKEAINGMREEIRDEAIDKNNEYK
ncbi:MAG: small acid-soluble spore protein Tlp [Eubacteriales bacterium]